MVVQVNDVGMVDNHGIMLGNYLLFDGKIVNVGSLQNNFYGILINGHMPESFKPIQLTEEILLKFGFIELPENSEWNLVLNISAAKLYVRGAYGLFYFQINETYLGDIIKSLHQLQNFCSVFSKELNVKF